MRMSIITIIVAMRCATNSSGASIKMRSEENERNSGTGIGRAKINDL